MISTIILAHALPLWQAVSPELQQAIQEQVQEELRRGRFREGFGPGGGGDLAPLIPIALFAMIVLIIFVIARRRQAELRSRAEFQKQVLDKFSSGKEFADFMGTEGSQRLLAALSTPAFTRYRVLGTMRGGIIVTVLGFGFLLLIGIRHGFIVPAVLLLALGAGLLISAAATHHLSKKWGGGGPATPGQPLSST